MGKPATRYQEPKTQAEPLASRIRPATLDEFIGQEHLVGEGKPLREAIGKKHRFSFILWGPPGAGKTTLARIYARALDAHLEELSAVSAGKEDIKKLLNKDTGGGPKVLFLDEIHRFNKAQQDFLLPYVESGEITLIGATTENPSFEVISPLLSRARVFTLNELSEDDMRAIVERAGRALSALPFGGQTAKGRKKNNVKIPQKATEWLIQMANGDARQAVGMIEHAHDLYGSISVETLTQTLQDRHLRYDKKGEEHYNTISAFIKSMRASQPDAAMYYLARMVEAGEDPKFIARRMAIFASEDIGLAQPTALVVANEVFRACETIGYPECAINLAHGVAYLSQAKKDRSAYNALRAAQEDVKKHGNLPIPLNVRNPVTKFMKEEGYGHGYQAYDTESFLPEKLKGKEYLNRTGTRERFH